MASIGKDLLVVSYLGLGAYKQFGYPGLAATLLVGEEICKTFWDTLQPKKKKARARGQALEWMSIRLEREFNALPETPSPDEREGIEACIAGFQSLQALCDELLGEHTPPLGPARRVLQARLKLIPEPVAEPEPAPAPPAPAPAPASDAAAAPAPAAAAPVAAAPVAPAPAPVVVAAPPSAPSAPTDTSAVDGVLSGAWDSLLAAADLLFAANPADPLSYSLRRIAAWTGLLKLPDSKGGAFGFEGGDGSALTKMEAALEASDFQALLAAAEPMANKQRLWLEPSYYAYQALDGLGKRYERAKDAVLARVLGLVTRHPSLPETKFSNDLPVLSAQGRLWLKSVLKSEGGGGGEGGADPLTGALGKARDTLLAGGLDEAIPTLLGNLGAQPTGARGRYRLRLAQARLCLEGGRPELARAQLVGLDAERERHGLDAWEPELAAEQTVLEWQALQAMNPKPKDAADRSAALHDRLCQLDLAAALALTP